MFLLSETFSYDPVVSYIPLLCVYLFCDSAMPKSVNKAKIACLDFSLQKAKMHLGVSVVVNDPAKLAAIRERWALLPYLHITPFSCCFFFRESDITKERIAKILGVGANVILTTGGIDDLCLKYFVEAGAMAVRRCKKEDIKRIARATGGKLC